MKKIALVALVATSAAVAAPFQGFSVGANLGASFNKFTVEDNNDKTSKKSNTLLGGLLVGYTKSFNNVIAGLDLGLGFENKKSFKYVDDGIQIGTLTIKPGMSFSFSPRVGYKFNDTTAAYFKLGMDIAKYEVKIEPTDIVVAAAAAAGWNFGTLKAKKAAFSVTPTLGFEKAMGSVSLRAELGYKMTARKTYFAIAGNEPMKAKRNAVIMTIGASYNF